MCIRDRYPNGGALSVRRFNEELLIVNRGDVGTGIIFEFSAGGPVKNPRIDNLTTCLLYTSRCV